MPAYHSLSFVRRCATGSWLRRSTVGLSAVGILFGLLWASPAPAQTPRRASAQSGGSGAARSASRYSAVQPAGDTAQGGPVTREYIDTPPTAEGQLQPYEFEAAGPNGEFVEGPYFDGPPGDGFLAGPSCAGSCCGSCWQNFSPHNFYVRADYLLWWGKGFYAPPLVTTSDAGTSQADAGVLGLSTTSVLFPTSNLATAAMSGGRIRLGYWFDPCDTSAIEGTYFGFGNATTDYGASSINYPILARPFVNVEEGMVGNDAQLVAYPGLYTGTVSVNASSQLRSAALIYRHVICRTCDWRIDWLAGWRYNQLNDSLTINSDQVNVGQTSVPIGTTVGVWDRFTTRNTFNGVQIGVITERRWCRWWLSTRGTLALGNNNSVVNIAGQSTTVNPETGTTVTQSGLLAQSTNIGRYTANDFAVVPQLGVNLGWEIAGGLWATVGYNFMYWSKIRRPGDQIDTDLNLSQLSPGGLTGLARPAYPGTTTDYWAQGLNFGLAYRY